MSIYTQSEPPTEEQQRQIAACDTTPLRFLDDLIASSDVKQEP